MISRAEGDEERIEERLAGVVLERGAIERAHGTTGREEHGMRGRRVPFAGRPEPRVDVRRALGHQAELQRAADGEQLVRTYPSEKAIERVAAMRAAANDPQRRARMRCHA